MKNTLLATLLSLISMVIHASQENQNVFKLVNESCRVLKSEDRQTERALPTEEECQKIEKIIGPIPQDLRQFYLNCGNKVLRGYELGFLYNAEQSSLAKLHEMAKEDEWSIPDNYFPFCRDQDDMFCLNKQDNTVFVFTRFDKQKSKIHDSFSIWLRACL